MSFRAALFSCVFVLSCGEASPPRAVGSGSGCMMGATQGCLCADASRGTQTCGAGGSFGACDCPPAVCGDLQCNGGENCLSCPGDCGACPACSATPSCDSAAGIPSSTQPETALDLPADAPDGGTAAPIEPDNCQAPLLRLRIAGITVNKEGGTLYCIVSASDGVSSEVAITTKTKNLNDGETNYFDPGVGLFWGQKDLKQTSNNVTITYDCFKVGSDAWSMVLMAVANQSMSVAGVAGPYGWIFGAASVGAAAAAAGISAASGDKHLFNYQQTIDKARLYELTNGRQWTLRQGGDCGIFCSWDWTVIVESWGCAAQKPGPM
jgi:hypothetical protein